MMRDETEQIDAVPWALRGPLDSVCAAAAAVSTTGATADARSEAASVAWSEAAGVGCDPFCAAAQAALDGLDPAGASWVATVFFGSASAHGAARLVTGGPLEHRDRSKIDRETQIAARAVMDAAKRRD